MQTSCKEMKLVEQQYNTEQTKSRSVLIGYERGTASRVCRDRANNCMLINIFGDWQTPNNYTLQSGFSITVR